VNEEEVRAAIENACQRLNIPGYLFLFMDGDRAKIVGNMSLSAIIPVLLNLKK